MAPQSAETGIIGPPSSVELPAAARVLLLTNGIRISQIVHAVARLELVDHLEKGALTAGELAEAVDCDPSALERLLRAASALGLVTREADGRYLPTPLSRPLRTGSADSVRDLVLHAGDETTTRPWARLVDAVRTGRAPFDDIFGRSFYAYLEGHPETAAVVQRGMLQTSTRAGAMVVGSCRLSRFRSIADIGGGWGLLLVQMLESAPEARGVLLEVPHVAAEARRLLAESPVADRVTVLTGDFADVPSGCDAYVLKSVLHNYDDDAALAILRAVRQAIGSDGSARLFVIEQIVGAHNEWDNAKFLDLDMLVKFGGLERDLDAWRRLLGSAGFELVNEPRRAAWTAMEWRPI